MEPKFWNADQKDSVLASSSSDSYSKPQVPAGELKLWKLDPTSMNQKAGFEGSPDGGMKDQKGADNYQYEHRIMDLTQGPRGKSPQLPPQREGNGTGMEFIRPGAENSKEVSHPRQSQSGRSKRQSEEITLESRPPSPPPTSNEVPEDGPRSPSFSSLPDLDLVAQLTPGPNRSAAQNSSSVKVLSASAILNTKGQPESESSMQRTAVNEYAYEKVPKVKNFSSGPAAGPFASSQWNSQRPEPAYYARRPNGGHSRSPTPPARSRRYQTLDLTGQRVLISDATEAIGRNCAFRFAELACDLILLGPDGNELQKLGRELDAEGFREARRGRPLKVELVKIDIRETHRIHALAMSLGPVDILINNAGMCFLALEDKMKSGSPLNKKEHDMLSLVYTSMISPMAFTSAFGYYMRERGSGHIVNVENSPAEDIDPNSAVYSSAVAGLGAFTVGARHDFVGTPVRVSSISPGYMRSSHNVGKNDCMHLLPEDIADHIVYTCTRPRHVQIANFTTFATNQSHINQNGIGAIAKVGPSLGFDAARMDKSWSPSPLSVVSASPTGPPKLPRVQDLRVVPGTVVSEESSKQQPASGLKVHRLDRSQCSATRSSSPSDTFIPNVPPQKDAFVPHESQENHTRRRSSPHEELFGSTLSFTDQGKAVIAGTKSGSDWKNSQFSNRPQTPTDMLIRTHELSNVDSRRGD
eukprot:gnl/MRDRNA2_/MRDRNA2_170694_c0_seq1.p1 gnl/MRDRNA2_/MRDRNA2_170694_c0~~gnl/MRDRNA2_/MRDRNA2_170694_c0_seq1.p1  ORF type:complete len:782 (+),score=108.06 gnl/MRDRNA2_/MRDRNA2_170694_c0_seq1:259-2346(+)